MIDAEMFSKIRACHDQGLTIAQTARALGLHARTVAKWVARSEFEPRRSRPRRSTLDPFKPYITKLLSEYPYSARQVFLRLNQKGYSGSLSILRDYISRIRPHKTSLKPRRQNGLWTQAKVREVASTCSTISQFRKLQAAAYSIAIKEGWIPEVCPHLPFVGRPSNSYTLRIERANSKSDINISKSSEKPSFVVPANFSIDAKDVWPNWSRDFTIPGKYTLEQLSEIILSLLGWDRNHLYEFRIANFVYANLVLLEEDDCVVDIDYPCVSCDIPIRNVGLTIGDNFAYIFDFADHHVFQLRVLDIRAASSAPKVTPSLISYRGTNIIQYPGIMSKSEEQAFKNRIPKIVTLTPIRDGCRIRFIRHKDASVLRKWRASNDKRNWQKAVTVLESRNQSIEGIARKIERSQRQVRRWIQVFNRFGLTGLKKPDGRKEPIKQHHKRAVIREQKARRILEIFHATPNSYGINRSNWNQPSVKQAYEKEYGETISISTVGELLRRSGYTIRKARKVLSSPDPRYREKVGRSRSC